MSYRITTIVPAPEGFVLDREGAVSTIVAFGLRDGDSPLPVTDPLCIACQEPLAREWHLAEVAGRVRGDSRHGYEAMHSYECEPPRY